MDSAHTDEGDGLVVAACAELAAFFDDGPGRILGWQVGVTCGDRFESIQAQQFTAGLLDLGETVGEENERVAGLHPCIAHAEVLFCAQAHRQSLVGDFFDSTGTHAEHGQVSGEANDRACAVEADARECGEHPWLDEIAEHAIKIEQQLFD